MDALHLAFDLQEYPLYVIVSGARRDSFGSSFKDVESSFIVTEDIVGLVGYVFGMSRHVFKTWRMSSLFRRHISQMSSNVATCRDMSRETCHMGG